MPVAIETPPKLFAENTCLITNHENVATLQDKMNMELKKFIFGVMPTNQQQNNQNLPHS